MLFIQLLEDLFYYKHYVYLIFYCGGCMKHEICSILTEIGENVERPGLVETPARIARMYTELLYGYDLNKKPKLTTFANGEDGVKYNQMVIDSGTFCSFCEHHALTFTGTYWFAYLPGEKIIGLSKIARVVSFHSARLQVQERLVKEIVDELWNVLKPKGIALVMKGRHLCKEIRGVKKVGEMITIELRGLLNEDAKTREEFFHFVQ